MLRKFLFSIFIFFQLAAIAQPGNLKLISWNIRDFGRTKSTEEIEEMAEIVRDADLIAIQEVVSGYGGAQAVARLAGELNRRGSAWDYVISNPTRSPKYVTERYAYLWKTSKLRVEDRGRLVHSLRNTVDREPFLLDIFTRDKKFSLLNFHSRPHDKNPEREILAITQFMIDSLSGPVLLAGDFNVPHRDPIFYLLKKGGYHSALNGQKTTLKRTCLQGEYRNYAIDNIFYSSSIKKTYAAVIDIVSQCECLDYARNLSDHLPVLLEVQIGE